MGPWWVLVSLAESGRLVSNIASMLADSLKAAETQTVQCSMLPGNNVVQGWQETKSFAPFAMQAREGIWQAACGSCTYSTYALKHVVGLSELSQEDPCSAIQSESCLLPAVSQSAWAGPALRADCSPRGGCHCTAAG